MQGIEKYLSHSGRIVIEDLDWEGARRAGLTDDERFILTYFSDIEGQTIFYLRDLLNTRVIDDPDSIAFLTIWNYEEYFHGAALSRLLEVCGVSLGERRTVEVHSSAGPGEKALAWAARLVSRLMPEKFLALYLAWGAINEFTTLKGYERLEAMTQNPVLKALCERIALQERRHFAWYFNSAARRLGKSSGTARFVRKMLKGFWTPVGAGVKKKEEVFRLLSLLFPGRWGIDFAREIDERISALPGLQDVSLMSRFFGGNRLESLAVSY